MNPNVTEKTAILCVDDEAIILMALKQELRASFGTSIDYETAYNADQALTTIKELRDEGIDLILVISDWLMPGIKGDEFLLEARKLYPTASAIMLTGQADDSSLATLQSSLPDLVVMRKPWNAKELKQAIEGCLASKSHGPDA